MLRLLKAVERRPAEKLLVGGHPAWAGLQKSSPEGTWANRRKSATAGRPSVSVPVLSKTTVRMRCARSSASAP